ncbi:Nitric oxide synthase, partial [Acropora cervicornis]
MMPGGGETPQPRPYGTPRDKAEVKLHAEDFLKQYFASISRSNSNEYHERLAEMMMYIEGNGSYSLLEKELVFAAKTAWRNASRCIERIQWNNLKVFDAGEARTAKEMFDALMRPLEFSLNKGNLRSAATIFPQRSEANKDFRIRNSQLIGFAGYRQPNGAVIGNPANVEFTEICQSLGWKGNGGRFDNLPLVLQAFGGRPEVFDIPNDHVFRVKIKHPKYPWFKKLRLQCFAIPSVSNIMLDAGGLEFTGTAFSGWYMVTEIGARDLADEQRYNMLEPKPWTVYSFSGETKKKISFKSVARYSVFGLGSRAYPDFCAFGHFVDDHLRELGAETILTMGEGDDLAGQEESFMEWTQNVFKMASNYFGVNTEAASKVVSDSLKEMVSGWSPGLYRWVSDNTIPMDLCTNLSKAYNKTVCSAKVISVTELQTKRSTRSTVPVSLVQELIDLMHIKPDPNQPTRIVIAHEDSGKQSGKMTWKPFNRLPAGCTLTEALTRYLDITAVPTPQMLKYLSKLGYSCYEEWALQKECNILETLREFPSVKATADLFLTQLPALQ